MISNKWVMVIGAIGLLTWSGFAQTAEDSVYTVQEPKGYKIPTERLDSMVILEETDATTEVVYAATHAPDLNQLNFDTAMAIEVEEIMDDLGYVDFAPDGLIIDRLSCLENEVPLNFHPRVKAFINYFAVKDRSFTLRVMQRTNLYFPIYERLLAKYNMPDELKYLSIIESALVPKARSRARAVGLWQFMAATGRMYGLKQDYYIDERMDPEKSTEAACKYLKSLYEMFNDWELAIAAYNCGPGNIRKAIRRSGYKKTFWEIFPRLPRETRSYLPQLVAMIYVLNHADELNLIQDQPFYAIPASTVEVSQFVDLGLLAEEINVCEEDLRLLNPELKKAAVPAYAKNYPLKIPKKRLNYFLMKRESILKKVSESHTYDPYAVAHSGTYKKPNKYYYVVRSGESLGGIAQKNGVGLSALKDWNNLSSNRIYAGQRLVVYSNGRKTTSSSQSGSRVASASTNGTNTNTFHRVRYGEVLGSIARKYGVSVGQLQKWNDLKGNSIYAGQKLRVKAPSAKASPTVYGTARYHIVKSGESLGLIAEKYGVSVSKIKSWNNLYSSRINVGQKLLIQTKERPISYSAKNTASTTTYGSYHIVKRGETLSDIATRYNVSVSELKSWNNIQGTRINYGQKLVLKKTGTVAASNSNTSSTPSNYKGKYHIVRRGETLSDIAVRHNVSIGDLQRWNNLDGTRINSGQKLKLTGAAAKSSARASSKKAAKGYYIVKSGDSLWTIAQAHNITVAKLKSLNGLRSSKLQVGQKLKVK
ncbi:MAG: LysM peptidoglycan-binding domain-containing protein [Flammeovirgaceae bacterium]